MLDRRVFLVLAAALADRAAAATEPVSKQACIAARLAAVPGVHAVDTLGPGPDAVVELLP